MKAPFLFGSVHLLFYRNDEVLLLKRQNTGFEDGKWSVVAGRMDGGEEVVSAAIREAKEESGVSIEPGQVDVVGVFHRKNTNSEWIDFFLKVRSWTGELHRTAIERDHRQMWFESVNW